MDIIEMLKHLPDEQKDAYMNLERLIESPGWDILKKDLEQQADSATSVMLHAKDWEEYKHTQGYLACLHSLINLDQRIEADFKAIAEQQKNPVEVAEEVEEEQLETSVEFL